MTLERLVTRLSGCGHEVSVFRPRQSEAAEARVNGSRVFVEERFGGLPIPGYPELRLGLPAKGRFVRRWRGNRPDVVHVATEGPLGRSAVGAACSLGIPLVTTFHTNFHDYMEHYRLGFLKSACIAYLRSMHNRALCNMVPDETLMNELVGYGFKSVSRLGRGVDTALFRPDLRDAALRASWGVNEGDPVYIHVSRAAKEKNIPFVIETFRRIQDRHPRARCVVVGGGPLLKKLRRGNDDIVFAGMRYGEDLARHYASGDVFLFGSVTETFGNVVTEGMASGLIVLAYDYAAAKQYIKSGENGFSVPAFDSEAFLKQALAISDKWSELGGLREAARRTARGLTWQGVVDVYLKTLKEHGVSGAC